jgi:uncharacterized membrane protein YdjX (TVP38/TMEM64 family)
VKKLFERLKRYSDKPWYLPLVCFLAYIDVFILVIPMEGLIVTSSILRPKRWLTFALGIATACALGGFTLSLVVHWKGEPFVAHFLGDHFFESKNWIRMAGWVDRWGFWGLVLIALGPLPQVPAVMLCSLAGMQAPEIFGAVWVGRTPKYIFFSYLSTHSPRLLKKLFGDEIEGVPIPETAPGHPKPDDFPG